MIDGSTQALPYIVFKLNDDAFALNIQYVTEITQVVQVSVLPEMPAHLLGLFQFRDRVVPLIDLKTRLGLTREAKTGNEDEDEERIMIVNDNGKWLGLKVDAINEVVQIQESQSLGLEDDAGDGHEAVDGVYVLGDDRVTVLKFDTIVDPERVINLTNWKQAIGS